MTSFPPNPPEQIIERLRKTRTWVNPGRPPLVYFEDAEAAVRAADSWWRSRLVSDETVEAVAQVIAGPAVCCCDDDWRVAPSSACPVHGEASWPYQHHYAKARAALAALLPVAEKPETDTCATCATRSS